METRRQVLIVSGNRESAAQLQAYFESRAVSATITGKLPAQLSPERPHALVLFPDDLEPRGVERWVQSFLAKHLGTSITIVTGDTQRFEELSRGLPQAARGRVTVLPRPAFSWTILDQVTLPFAENAAKGES